MEVLRRLAHKLIRRPYRARQARAKPRGWPYATADLRRPGINEVAASARTPAPTPETWVTHPLDLGIGEVADGYHLIVRSISLSAKHLLFEFAFVPGRTEGAEVWLKIWDRIYEVGTINAGILQSRDRKEEADLLRQRLDARG